MTVPTQDTRPLIAHLIYRLDVGGLENILVELIRGLPADRYRHTVICLADYGSFRDRLPAEVPVHALHKPPGLGVGTAYRLWRLLRRIQPDILHSCNLAALEGQPLAWLAGVRGRIHVEHGWDMADLDGRNPKYRWLRRALSPFVHRHVAVSRHLAQYLVDQAGIPERRVRHVCNGVDTRRFTPAPPRSAKTPIVMGSVGRLTAVKDQASLICAFARLKTLVPERFPDLRLHLLGDGPEFSALRQLAASEGVAEQVWMPGNRDDVAEQLQQMDVFVLPSLAEGIPVTVLEAMATGLPVVASRVGGLPELVAEGETGHLLPAGDPQILAHTLASYVNEPDKAFRQGRAARERAEYIFDSQVMLGAYANLYDEVLAQQGRRKPSL